ncbi:hypothetical protein CAPTEDRAFT_197853 [Capitella teleta]|uniref:Uncharacterized protein n=1 Tax=Capitella teleta TaxID=283909 RepID=R7T7V6_CAPTE|nr:hypothetical protein CAPTEDRAFT_197853 [Capitella teleta]|eukprot:ELT87079.1 hypothetical protein CAPTEDRAFT_197853 [Capitella teleta]
MEVLIVDPRPSEANTLALHGNQRRMAGKGGDQSCVYFLIAVRLVFGALLIVLGFLGNGATIFVLGREKQESANYSLEIHQLPRVDQEISTAESHSNSSSANVCLKQTYPSKTKAKPGERSLRNAAFQALYGFCLLLLVFDVLNIFSRSKKVRLFFVFTQLLATNQFRNDQESLQHRCNGIHHPPLQLARLHQCLPSLVVMRRQLLCLVLYLTPVQ